MSDSIRRLFDMDEVRRALTILVEPKSVFEVRALEAQLSSERRTGIVSGYFDNVEECVKQLSRLTSARGIYVTLNPLDPALLARRANRLDYVGTDGTTSDQHVLTRRWLLIDVDADRPSGISATDAEKEAAHAKSREIYRYLKERDWPEPIAGDSGNGIHLLCGVKFPRDDQRLFERLLTALANRFDDDCVKIDRAVHNPARIVRLYGTLAAKGDNTKDRPHRLSKIITRHSLVAQVKDESLRTVLTELEPATQKVSDRRTIADRNSKADKSQIREMLAVIPKRPDYADWIRIVAAVGDALPDEDAIELLKEWSPEERDGEYADKLRHRLENVHIGTLIHLAKQHGWTPKIANGEKRQGQTPELSSLNSSRPVGDDVVDEFPEPPDEAAFYGLAGDIVRRIEPHTEADSVALLGHYLVAFGNVVDRSPHAIADGSRHGTNIFGACVGETSKARKGTSASHNKRIFRRADEAWGKECVTSGLSSGEGLIYSVRDSVVKRVKQKGGGYANEIVDDGVADKRRMFIESEFASTLRVMGREGNTLSAVIRQAWDDGDLRTAVKNSPNSATGAHISIIAHVTRDEVRRELCATDQANGFANRFQWYAVRRSKCLPEGGNLDDDNLNDLVTRTHRAIEFAKKAGVVTRDDDARKLWCDVYPELSEGKPGLLGAITARAEAQVLRLSLIYALLDLSTKVRPEHLKAALALWDYSERSARWIFGTATGDTNADRILSALRAAGSKGMTQTQISERIFNRNVPANALSASLRILHESGKIKFAKQSTGGAPRKRWFATKV